jgi:hypothetical protein
VDEKKNSYMEKYLLYRGNNLAIQYLTSQIIFTLLSMVAHAQSPFVTSSQGDGSVGSEGELRFAARGVGIHCTCPA